MPLCLVYKVVSNIFLAVYYLDSMSIVIPYGQFNSHLLFITTSKRYAFYEYWRFLIINIFVLLKIESHHVRLRKKNSSRCKS